MSLLLNTILSIMAIAALFVSILLDDWLSDRKAKKARHE